MSAWQKYKSGKTRKYDVMFFERHLEDNLFNLYDSLRFNTYQHSAYTHFQVFDSKKRDIHKAEVRDRLVHQIIFDYLEEIFEPLFIADSYSSRKQKGSHRAIQTFRYFSKLLQTKRGQVFVFKCDIRKYFNNVKQDILLKIIKGKVVDERIFEIIQVVVSSFKEENHIGMPLGNITSQIFANIYLDKLDQFVKKELGARYYIRYNDDFVIMNNSKLVLEKYLPKIREFLDKKLKLEVPAEKTSIRKIEWGVDFLGYIILPNAILLRPKTKQKIFERLTEENIYSYLGLLKYCNSYTLKQKIISIFDNREEYDILYP